MVSQGSAGAARVPDGRGVGEVTAAPGAAGADAGAPGGTGGGGSGGAASAATPVAPHAPHAPAIRAATTPSRAMAPLQSRMDMGRPVDGCPGRPAPSAGVWAA